MSPTTSTKTHHEKNEQKKRHKRIEKGGVEIQRRRKRKYVPKNIFGSDAPKSLLNISASEGTHAKQKVREAHSKMEEAENNAEDKPRGASIDIDLELDETLHFNYTPHFIGKEGTNYERNDGTIGFSPPAKGLGNWKGGPISESMAEQRLKKWFPSGTRTYCIRRMLDLDKPQGREGKDATYYLFRDPRESPDFTFFGGVPVALFKKQIYFGDGEDENVTLRIFRFAEINLEVLETDLVISARINLQELGTPHAPALPPVLSEISKLSSISNELSKNLDDWYGYLNWRAIFESNREWGAKITQITPPTPEKPYFEVKVTATKNNWDEIRRTSRSKNSSRIIIFKSNSKHTKNRRQWIRKAGDDIFHSNTNNPQVSEAGQLLRNPIETKDVGNGLFEGSIRISPPNSENLNIGLDPEENIGDFLVNDITINLSDIKRQKSAIEGLVKLESSGFNRVHEWLFDISKARPITEPLEDLPHEPKFTLNENQKRAVLCALACEDVSLIQGPPGTGKTTVISEIINQVTKQGGKVLLSSQSNDAVDNALSRLNETPNVRPIRRVARSREQDPDSEKFLENNVVKSFYIPSLIKGNIEESKSIESWLEIREYPEIVKQLSEIKKDWEEQRSTHRSLRKNLASEKIERGELEETIEMTENEISNIERAEGLVASNSIDRITDVMIGLIGPISDPINKLIELNALLEEDEHIDEIMEIIGKAEYASENDDSYHEWAKTLDPYINLGFEELKPLISINMPANLQTLVGELEEQLVDRNKELSSRIIGFNDEELIEKINNEINQSLVNKRGKLEDARKKSASKSKHIEELNLKSAECKKRFNDADFQWTETSRSLALLGEIGNVQEGDIDKLTSDANELFNLHQSKFPILESWLELTNQLIQDLLEAQKSGKKFQDLKEAYESTVNVEGVTTSISGSPYFQRKFINSPFDIVIIDEISKATPTELLMSMMTGRKVILVGDYNQLPPMFKKPRAKSEISAEEALKLDSEARKYSKLVTNSIFSEFYQHADSSIKVSLTEQYRMHRQIMECVNEFYEEKLSSGFSNEVEDERKQHGFVITKGVSGGTNISEGSILLGPERHVAWVDSTFDNHGNYCSEEEGKIVSTSRRNVREIEISMRIIDDIDYQVELRKESVDEDKWDNDPMLQHLNSEGLLPLAFITFYQDQVNAFLEIACGGKSWSALSEKWPNLSVKAQNVDRFQGSERGVVICSMVLSPEPPKNKKVKFENAIRKHSNNPLKILKSGKDWAKGGIPEPSHKDRSGRPTTFAAQPERINVAFSRAQNLLVIVGNRFTFNKVKVNLKGSNSASFSYANIQRTIGGGIIDGRDIL